MDREKDATVYDDQLDNIEVDTIGEILNISMGAAATAVSTLLDRQVNITTPRVSVIQTDEFECKSLEPAVGIEIEYIEGLSGSNFMIMKRRDIRAIVNLLISGDGNADTDDEDEELDEMHLSAIGEIMNQMMGSSSTALANFLGKSINISTPKRFDLQEIKTKMADPVYKDHIVTVAFNLKVEGLIDSEFITILPVDFTKELVKKALNFGDEKAEPQVVMESAGKESGKTEGKHEQNTEVKIKKHQQPQETNPAPQEKASKVNVQPLRLENFNDSTPGPSEEAAANLGLIMSVPLDITVEIGRTKKQVQEILDLRQGSIVELDKQAGDPVDVMVNGQLMARGDVVVIDDNFGVRITEIVSNKEIANKFR